MINVTSQEMNRLCSEVADLANKCYNTDMYLTSDVEVLLCFRNYDDGRGDLLSVTISLRNPDDGLYDMSVNVIGSVQEGFQQMLHGLKLMKQENFFKTPLPTKPLNKLN